MFDEDVDLQKINDYFENQVINQLLEQMCREAVDAFKENPGKNYIQALSIMCRVPVKTREERMNVISFFRARRPENLKTQVIELCIDYIHITETIPHELIDTYNKSKNIPGFTLN